jgi:5-methylcytosine-specific restriction protein B
LKLLHSYFPNEFAPINSVVCLNNVLKLLGVDTKGMNSYQKNQAVKNYFESMVKSKNLEINIDEFVDYLFQTFDLKGHVELKNDTLYTKGEMKIIQFHPAYSYEDFVRGIEVSVTNSEKPEYKVVNKVLAEFAQKAFENNNSTYVLIIDEINRANLASVLGELIYALEYRYDPNKPDETSVESMYKLDEVDEIETDIQNKLKLPKNLKIIGTMNTADRSVGHIDYAIRRRFAFVDVLPTIEPIREAGLIYFKKVCGLFIKNFDSINWNDPVFEPSEHLASDFKPNEVMLGHSYFIMKEKDEDGNALDENEEMQLKLEFEIIPILKEYIKDGILNDQNNDLLKDIC